MHSKNSKKYAKYITILCSLLILVNILNLTLAFFTDKEIATAPVLTFGNIDIDAKIVKQDSTTKDNFLFDSPNVMTGETIERIVSIENVDDAQSCVVRMRMCFELKYGNVKKDVTGNNYIEFLIQDEYTNWSSAQVTQDEKMITYWYYNNVLQKNSQPVVVGIKFNVTDVFGRDAVEELFGVNDISSIQYNLTLYVEAIQYANGSYKTLWKDQTPVGWNPLEE